MKLKIQRKGQGPGPSEHVVSVRSVDGTEQLVLSSRKVVDDFIEIGDPLAEQNGSYLVELPRETASGRWRVWVPYSEVKETPMLAAE